MGWGPAGKMADETDIINTGIPGGGYKPVRLRRGVWCIEQGVALVVQVQTDDTVIELTRQAMFECMLVEPGLADQ